MQRTDGLAASLRVNETFHSIQGEGLRAGEPCFFIRLTGCPLRCAWCDTAYAFREGAPRSIESLIDEARSVGCPLVQVTGGEPLAQKGCLALVRALCDAGFTVTMETSGALDISPLDPRCVRIMDLKCPASGESNRNLWSNVAHLCRRDEVKFVIADRGDYEWAKARMMEHALVDRVAAVLMSAAWAQPKGAEIAGSAGLSARDLAAWILADGLRVRMQTQLHKIIWDPQTRGV
ncbi:MAG: radical SAM protein [Planctomycetota bacterium]